MLYLVGALLIAARLLRALHDTMTHEPLTGKPAKWGPFWGAYASWVLKYKNNDPAQGPKFPGSTTVLVGFTDGWHLSNLLSWGAMDAAFILVAWERYQWWAVGFVVVARLCFEPLYRYLRQ